MVLNLEIDDIIRVNKYLNICKTMNVNNISIILK